MTCSYAVAPDTGQELVESVHQVASVSTQLQETIMDIRMLPIRHVFERFPRLELAEDGNDWYATILGRALRKLEVSWT